MKLQKGIEIAIALLLSVSMTGCATIFHGSTQQVSIRSNVEGAKLYVNEGYVGQGSAITTFHKNKNYTIVARKEGMLDGTATPTKSFDATSLLGIFLDFGIISMLCIDGIATGAINQFDQENYIVDPRTK